MATQNTGVNQSREAANWIALLGRRETPTDGVQDYCDFLANALARRGVRMETARVDWAELGWRRALRRLREQCADWRGSWVVVQYTAMAWSRRGFPFGVLLVLSALRRSGLRCAVVFHESTRQLSHYRLRDRLRGRLQEWVIHRLFCTADVAIFTIPLACIDWLPEDHSKAVYIPIGSNIPERASACVLRKSNSAEPKTVAVFCLSAGENRIAEIADLVHVAGRARDALGDVRFVIIGKGSAEARDDLERALRPKGVKVCVPGRLSADRVAETLAAADVQLYLGAYVTQTRGSALAGVACGLPIVGYTGKVREPIHEAGVQLVPSRDADALAEALIRVLKDGSLRAQLKQKSREAQQRHFSWDAIAAGFTEALSSEQPGK